MFLLDTNMISFALRDPLGQVAQRIMETPPDLICTSILVECELRFGCEKRNALAILKKVEFFLDRIAVLDFGPPAQRAYASLRARLEANGTPIGALDTLIAAHALALDAVLVTNNTAEFARVSGLKQQDWTQA